MTWFVLQSLFFILGAFLLGLLVGWVAWGRQTGPERIVVLHADGRRTAATTRPVRAAAAPAAPVATVQSPAPAADEPEPDSTDDARPWNSASAELRARPGAQADVEAGAVDGAEPSPFAPAPAPVLSEPEPAAEAEPGGETEDIAEAERTDDEAEPETEPESDVESDSESDADADGGPAVDVEPTDDAVADTEMAADADADANTDAETADDAEPDHPDDLRVIEGIGPKVADALADGGIRTYAELAATDRDRLRSLMHEAGLRFSPSLPSWPDQAALLAAGDDEGFAVLSAREAANRRAAGTV